MTDAKTEAVAHLVRFDPRRAYAHTKHLCFPRRVGTPYERRAAQYIAQNFLIQGLRLDRQPFRFSHFPFEVGSRIIFALCLALAIVGAMLAADVPLAAAFAWGLAGFLISSPWRVACYLGQRFPPFCTSENLLATLPASEPGAPARVIFMAHYDTKSQYLPTGIRVGLVSIGTILCGIFSLLAVLAAAGLPQPLLVAGPWSLPILITLVLAGLVANFSGNRSPGALDNGSGVATLLEMARSWRPHAQAPVEVYWVATGSEEAGLEGARHFLKRYAHWWSEKPTLLINLESVGAGPRLYLSGEPHSLRLTHAVAEELGLPHHELHVMGAGMDHQPFAACHLASLSILGDVVRRSFVMHSARDDLKVIEASALERAGRLASHLAWVWAELHQPATTQVALTSKAGAHLASSP